MNLEEYHNNNRKSFVLQSDIPEVTQNEPCCLGIDEAGRGPVLGPMVYGVCFCPISMKEKLADLGFADSKTINEENRDRLLAVIEENKDYIGWAVKVICPTQISNDMLRRTKITLNELSHNAAIELVQKSVASAANIREMYVDTVGDATKYQAKLSQIFPDITVKVTPKADALFPVVSAASICAKVARDRCLKKWIFSEGEFPEEYGCGYPSDPKTKKWLKDITDPVFGYPQFVRFSWSTCSNLLEKDAKEVTWDDNEEVDEAAKGTAPITSFFGQQKKVQTVDRSKFFTERKLLQVYDLL
ncbi:ribonuclease H2 subunit A-like isoform X2 [Hydractinia symbiolongicarpus]|uniref:ribonuclease H2 subunit A-like isoform X2 n=1 Tax=Hydractinia symbiolongicarpus TaxID=13093 RepID=UPI00255058C8|nr:ribonuclease H2 subunit A-like isoform X2 [Hydractinia symbiolongicarpus]